MARSGPVTKDTSSVLLGLAQIRVGPSAPHISNRNVALTPSDSIGALGEVTFNSQTQFWKMKSGFPKLEDFSIPTSEEASLSVTYQEVSSRNMALARGISPFADTSATVSVLKNNSAAGTVTGDITVTDAGGAIDDEFTVVFSGATAGSIYGKNTGLVHTFTDLTTVMAPDNSGNPYFSIPANYFSGTWAANDSFVFKTTPFIAGTTAYADNHAGEINLGSMVAPAFIRVEAVATYPNGINHMYIVFPRANASGSAEISFQDEDAAAPPITFEAKRADSETAGGNAAWDNGPLGRIYFD